MRRAGWGAAALACVGVAAAIGAGTPPAPAGSAVPLGGLRPLLADALFLRAESLRRRGRHDEVASLYRRVLDLDPGSEAATDYLAATEAYDLRGEAPTAAGRVRWFRAALDLVERALARAPRSARLRWRAANLLVQVADADEAVAAHLAEAGRDRLGEALRHLLEAVRETDSLGRLGFEHLDDLVRLAPRVAAERLARGGAGAEEGLAAGDEALRLRAEALRSFVTSPTSSYTAHQRLQAGLNLVRATARGLGGGPERIEGARGLLRTYREELGDDAVTAALAPLLR